MTAFWERNAFSVVIGAVGLMMGLLGALFAYDSARLRYNVAVSPEGIWYLPSNKQSIYVPWNEVGNLKPNDTMQWLVVTDVTGAKSFRLDYQLESFTTLRDFILTHSVTARRQSEAIGVFHRTWINKALLLVLGVVLLPVWEQIRFNQIKGVLCLLIMLLLISAFVRDPTSLVITPAAVVIIYVGWKQTIPFNTITEISMKEVAYRGNNFQAVIIDRQSGKPIKLFRFREGFIALHDALDTAWRAGRKFDLPG